MNVFKDLSIMVHKELEHMTNAGELPRGLDLGALVVEPPRDPAHGDVATNAALTLARPAGRKPRDIAEPLAGRLARRAACQGREVTMVDGTGERLPFPDGSFDSVVTTLVLCSVGDLHEVVREARRVLREDGRFYFYEHVVASGTWKRVLQKLFRRPWRLLVDGCHLDRDIESAVRSVGFREVTVRSFDLSVGVLVTLPNVVGVAVR